MNIRYVDFAVTTTSRIYLFHVVGSDGKTREFTVEVQQETFHLTRLGFQDGPNICLARLKRELEAETEESPAELHLRVGTQDIQECLQRRHPRKRL